MMRHYVSALPDVALCGLILKPAEREEFDPSGSVCDLCSRVAERRRGAAARGLSSGSDSTVVATLRDGMIVGEVHYADARVIASPGGNALRCGAQITEPSTDRLEAVTCEGCRRAIVLVVGADGAPGPMTAWAASCLNLPMRGPFPSDVPTSQLVNAAGLSPDHARAVRAEHRVAELEAVPEEATPTDLPTYGCQCEACQARWAEVGVRHWSDCAVHNEPAMPMGPCGCMDYAEARYRAHAEASLARAAEALREAEQERDELRLANPPLGSTEREQLRAECHKLGTEVRELRRVAELQKAEGERLREGWDRQVNELGRQLNDGRRTIEKLCAERDSLGYRLAQSQKDYAKALEERNSYMALSGRLFGNAMMRDDIERARMVADAVGVEREAILERLKHLQSGLFPVGGGHDWWVVRVDVEAAIRARGKQ